MTVKEIKELLNKFYIFNSSKEELVLLNSQIESIKDDPLFLEVLVKQISNEAFYYIVEKFNIPENIVHQRQELQINILKNPLNYPLTVVQNALCDILFHNNPRNSKLTIKTLKESAGAVPSFNNLYQNVSGLYSIVLNFLNLDPATATPEQITSLLQTAIQMNNELVGSNSNAYSITSLLWKYANEDCKSDMCNKVSASYAKMFKGITPVLDGSDKAPVTYRLKNQTENQRGLFLLIRTDSFQPYMIEENALAKHMENAAKYENTSYSIITESHTTRYCEKSTTKITFAYFPNKSCNLISCTPHDGQTFCYDMSRGQFAMKQSFVPIEEFMNQTSNTRHNEFMFETPELMEPAMVIIFNDTDISLAEKSIEVAHAMNLPLVYIDKTAYPEHNPQNPVDFDGENNLLYKLTLPQELEPISPELLVE